MANPSTRWDFVPVFGVYLRLDDTPSAGRVTFTMPSRVTRVDGRVIYPEGASITVTIGDTTQQDSAIRSAVRAAWRAADEASQGAGFDAVAWDTWWDDVVVPAAIFTSFPASDDPDIVQQNWSVSVSEGLTSGKGRSYAIQPLLAHLDQPIPGINLGTIEVPPGSPTVPAPMYAKGIAGGVAALDADGDVVDAGGNKIAGAGGGSGSGSSSRLVTGTVTLPTEDRSRGPFVVATTTSAIVEGVALAAGQMAAFWWLDSEWHVMVHGTDVAWRSTAVPDTRIEVLPTAPTFIDNTADGGGTWTTPVSPQVTYVPSGGTATPGQQVTVNATITNPSTHRFAAGAVTSWSHTFHAGPAPWEGATYDFSGPADATIVGRTTTTGGLTFSADSAMNGPAMTLVKLANIAAQPLALTGSGAAKHAASGDVFSNASLTLPTNKFDLSLSYSGFAEAGQAQVRMAVGSTAARVNLTGTNQYNVEVFSGGWAKDTIATTPFAASGTVRFLSTGSAVSLYYNGTLLITKNIALPATPRFVFGVGRAADPCVFSDLTISGV